MPNGRLPEEIYDPQAGWKAFTEAFKVAQERVRTKREEKRKLMETLQLMMGTEAFKAGQIPQAQEIFSKLTGQQVDVPSLPGVQPGLIPKEQTVGGVTYGRPERIKAERTERTGMGKELTFWDIRKRAEDQASKLATKIFNIGGLVSKMRATTEETAKYIKEIEIELIEKYSKEEGISLPVNWKKNLPEVSLIKRLRTQKLIDEVKKEVSLKPAKWDSKDVEKRLKRKGITPTPEIINEILGITGKQKTLREIFG